MRPAGLSDTEPSVNEVLFAARRSLPPGDKVRQVFELTELLLRLSEAGVRRMYPDADDREVFLRAAARRLGRETVARVYGWNPET
jgi:hypothetical protein